MLRLLPVSRLLTLLPDPNCILYTSFVPNPLKALFSLLRRTMTRQLRSLTFPPFRFVTDTTFDRQMLLVDMSDKTSWKNRPMYLVKSLRRRRFLSLWQNGNFCLFQFWTFFSRGRRVLCNLSEIRSECSQCHQLVILVRLHRKRD